MNQQDFQPPFYPIIYIRGYAMTDEEKDETVSDPFCGFNIGSTVYRATASKLARKRIFESPTIRLATDFGYQDAMSNGIELEDEAWQEEKLPAKSIVVYRYYQHASEILGNGETPDIYHYAAGLSDLILKLKKFVSLYYKDNPNYKESDFRCYLVAHSLGGLICRAFLQNPYQGKELVAKVFTYGTPHNGIEMAGIKPPSWLSLNQINFFNLKYMAQYLNLSSALTKTKRVDWLPENCFNPQNFFCMIGTNRADYKVAFGIARTFSGDGSDGLVKIANAAVWGIDKDDNLTQPSPTAYAYRSHSGYFGLVNSEESYQNLIRFLFGDLKVEIIAEIEQVILPINLQKSADQVEALYQFELTAAPKGCPYLLTRRVAEEDSVACMSYHKWRTEYQNNNLTRKIYLSTIFLDKRWRSDKEYPALNLGVSFAARVPDYTIDKKYWFDEHFEGKYVGKEDCELAIDPTNGTALLNKTQQINYANNNNEIAIPLNYPEIKGKLIFKISKWN